MSITVGITRERRSLIGVGGFVVVASAWAAVVPIVASWDVAVALAVLTLGTALLMGGLRRLPRDLRRAVLIGLMIRAGVALPYLLGVPLLSNPDELAFMNHADSLSASGWGASIGAVLSPSPLERNAYSAVIALVQLSTGGGEATARMLNVLLGTVIVLLAGLIAREIWGRRPAAMAALLTAIFPTAVLYSVLILREALFTTLMLVAILAGLRWMRARRVRHIVVVAGCGLAMLQLHPGAVAVLAGIGIAMAVSAYRRAGRGRRTPQLLTGAFVLMILVAAFSLDVGVLRTATKSQDGLGADTISTALEQRAKGTAGYLVDDVPSTWQGLAAQAPLRVVYFLFSPFPWQITSSEQFLGLIDAAGFAAASFLLLRRWRDIRGSPPALAALIVLAVFIGIFSFGVSNFGTAIRHRAKATALFAALVSGLLVRRTASPRPATASGALRQ